MNKDNAILSPEERAYIEKVVQKLLAFYKIGEPPVPITDILREPPPPMVSMNPVESSFVLGYGLYKDEPRLALARLFYRNLSNEPGIQQTLQLNGKPTTTSSAARAFARALLMPEDWIRQAWNLKKDPEALAEVFEVPSYAVLIRLEELQLAQS